MIVIPDMTDPPSTAQLTEQQRLMYNDISLSPRTYYYDSWDALAFELKVREAIMKAARDMDASEVSFASFKQSRCNEAMWERQENGAFLLREGVSSADAIRDIYINGKAYAFECATAIIILLYKAVLDIIGDRKFNKLFAGLYLYSWTYDRDLRLITDHTGAPAFGGDILYFKNPQVNPEYMEWQGENAVKLGRNQYFGHGIGIATAEMIIGKLNKLRIPGATESAYLMDDVTHPDFAYLYRIATSDDPAFYAASRIQAVGRVVAVIGGRVSIH